MCSLVCACAFACVVPYLSAMLWQAREKNTARALSSRVFTGWWAQDCACTGAQAEQKLVHSMDNLVAFTTLNVEMPLTSSKVPATLEVIKTRKEYYLKKRAQVLIPVLSMPTCLLGPGDSTCCNRRVDVGGAPQCFVDMTID